MGSAVSKNAHSSKHADKRNSNKTRNRPKNSPRGPKNSPHGPKNSPRANNNSTKKYGDKKTRSNVEGYEGEFYGIIHDKKTGKKIVVDDEFDEEDDYPYIQKKLKSHCAKYCEDNFTKEENKELDDPDSEYEFICGFGGDEQDGIINFFVDKKIPLPPNMEIEFDDKTYIMSFKFR
jgi:hypothetical protein